MSPLISLLNSLYKITGQEGAVWRGYIVKREGSMNSLFLMVEVKLQNSNFLSCIKQLILELKESETILFLEKFKLFIIKINMGKIRKDVGVKIIFDNGDYSPEECSYLYGRFFNALSKLAKKETPESFIKKVFPPEIFKK